VIPAAWPGIEPKISRAATKAVPILNRTEKKQGVVISISPLRKPHINHFILTRLTCPLNPHGDFGSGAFAMTHHYLPLGLF
jgi:hypothetical protein